MTDPPETPETSETRSMSGARVPLRERFLRLAQLLQHAKGKGARPRAAAGEAEPDGGFGGILGQRPGRRGVHRGGAVRKRGVYGRVAHAETRAAGERKRHR